MTLPGYYEGARVRKAIADRSSLFPVGTAGTIDFIIDDYYSQFGVHWDVPKDSLHVKGYYAKSEFGHFILPLCKKHKG